MASVTQFATGTRTTSPVEGAFVALGTDPQTIAGHFSIFIDLSEMQAADVTIIQLVEKATASGDTQRVVWAKTFTGVQAEPGFLSPPHPMLHGWAFQMEQTAGSARNYKWSIRESGS